MKKEVENKIKKREGSKSKIIKRRKNNVIFNSFTNI